jgi:HK97 family phage portal protein
MNIFGRKSAGRAVSRPASFGLGFGQAFASAAPVLGEWPRSYERQVRELYLTNAVAQRAVRLVAEGVASVPVSATDPVAAALVATTSGGQSLMETLAMQLLLHGNGYVQLLSDPNGQPAELYALRPERMSVVPDARGWPSGFIYRSGADAVRIPVAEIIHIRTNHPLDDHYGLGCLGAASGPIAIHNAATKWNKALLDNAARPSGALVYEPGDPGATLSRDQFDRLKTEMEASFSGAMNAGKPMLLEGGLKWQSMSLSPTDMDFIGLKSAAARDIALAFGVPPMLLGLPGDATFANYREANKALFRLAILPLAGKILNAIAQGLRTWFPELALTIDMDQVGALAEDRERLWAQVSAADFLTLEEKRALVGYDGVGGAEVTDPTQLKFNQNHDPSNGQFTFGAGGRAHLSDSVTVDLGSGVGQHRNGSIDIPLDPPIPYRHYHTDPGVEIPPQTHEKVNEMAKQFTAKTGKSFTVISGLRSSHKQANAMYVKFSSGSLGNDYRNKTARAQIYNVYVTGQHSKQAPAATIAQMRQIIDKQVQQGTYISLHMTGRAIDIRTKGKGYTASDKAHLRAAAASQGGQFHPEPRPEHIHVQFH